jgi:hypothetical protein
MNFKKLSIVIVVVLIGIYIKFEFSAKVTIEQQVEKLLNEDDSIKQREIAFSLADSLDIKAIDLLFRTLPNEISETAIKDMMLQYSNILNSEESKKEKIVECLNYITNLTSINDTTLFNTKFNFILYGLEIDNGGFDFQNVIIESATKYGNKGMVDLIDAWKYNRNSNGLRNAVSSFGQNSINYLSNLLGSDTSVEDLIARIGEPAIDNMVLKMKSESRLERFAAVDALVKMNAYHPEAIEQFTSALENGGLNTVARNYPFYIRLGKSGTVDLLLKALDQYFQKEMCLDYLNCGSQILDKGAKKIAEERGFMVYSDEGYYSGPEWGQGN